MASVLQANVERRLRLARGLRLYDAGGDLPERAARAVARSAPAEIGLARDFWRRYASRRGHRRASRDASSSERADASCRYHRGKVDAALDPATVAEYGRRSMSRQALVPRLHLSTCSPASTADDRCARFDDRFAAAIATSSTVASPALCPTSRRSRSTSSSPRSPCSKPIEAADQRGRESEQFERRVAERRPRQHRAVEGADRPHPRRPPLRRAECSARPAKSPPPPSSRRSRCAKRRRPPPA